jgi:Zn-dependent metalloprotease
MTRNLLAALATLTLCGCGRTETPVTSTQQVDAVESIGTVKRAQQALRGSQEPGEELVVRSVMRDDTGAEHVRFDKRFQGLRVIGGDMVVHLDEYGLLREVSASTRHPLQGLSLKPAIDAAGASVLAEKAFHGQRTGPATAELVVSVRGETPELAHEVVLEGFQKDGTPSELHVLVNAHTGAIIDSWDKIETRAAIGQGYSLYSSSVSLNTDWVAGGYAMRDTTRGSGFATYNMNNGTSGMSIFMSGNNVWGTHYPSSPVSAAVDAHFGVQKAYDYYKNVHGRSGINGSGSVGYNRVHYGVNYNNAFWSDGCTCMTYGDGDGNIFSTLVSLDVVAHEMTHGVTSSTAGLIYSGESGGLNEATSDIFGSMVEFYGNRGFDPADYKIGEQVYTPNTPWDALRYMYNPSLDGISANCWSNSVGSMDVHHSSGVANHFFYLLAEGSNGNPASPTCNGSTVTGIGRPAAEKIWYRALTVYMTSSTNYAGARGATLSAAQDLFGTGSIQHNAVAAAWAAVNVNY